MRNSLRLRSNPRTHHFPHLFQVMFHNWPFLVPIKCEHHFSFSGLTVEFLFHWNIWGLSILCSDVSSPVRIDGSVFHLSWWFVSISWRTSRCWQIATRLFLFRKSSHTEFIKVVTVLDNLICKRMTNQQMGYLFDLPVGFSKSEHGHGHNLVVSGECGWSSCCFLALHACSTTFVLTGQQFVTVRHCHRIALKVFSGFHLLVHLQRKNKMDYGTLFSCSANGQWRRKMTQSKTTV